MGFFFFSHPFSPFKEAVGSAINYDWATVGSLDFIDLGLGIALGIFMRWLALAWAFSMSG